jgi:hypothetical protein
VTTDEFKACCAELEAKRADGRALEEAQARLRAGRRQRRVEPTADDLADDEFQWDRHSPENQRWHE